MLDWLRSPRLWAVLALIMLLAAIANVVSAIIGVATGQAGLALICALLAVANGGLACLYRRASRRLREPSHV